MWLIFVPIFFSRLEGTYGIRKYHISIYSYVVSTYFDCNPQDKMAKSVVHEFEYKISICVSIPFQLNLKPPFWPLNKKSIFFYFNMSIFAIPIKY